MLGPQPAQRVAFKVCRGEGEVRLGLGRVVGRRVVARPRHGDLAGGGVERHRCERRRQVVDREAAGGERVGVRGDRCRVVATGRTGGEAARAPGGGGRAVVLGLRVHVSLVRRRPRGQPVPGAAPVGAGAAARGEGAAAAGAATTAAAWPCSPTMWW